MSSLTDEQIQRLWRLGADLTEEVRGAPERVLRGSVLGTRVQGYDRSLLQAVGLKLAVLLDQYAPELMVVGRVGVDLLWGLQLPRDAPVPDVSGAVGIPALDWPRLDGVRWEAVELHNYRSVQHASLVFADLTVLVGKNGAGKSNILDGIFRLSRLTGQKPAGVFSHRHSPDRVTGRWSPASGFQLRAIASNDWAFQYSSGNPFEPNPQPPFQVQLPARETEPLWSLGFTPISGIFGGAVYLHLDASQLSRPTHSLEEVPYLRHDGAGLGPVLATIAQTDRARLDRIIAAVRVLVPRVEDIRTDRQPLETPRDGLQIANGVEVRMTGVGWIPADQLSEGTLLAIGLHTVLSQPEPPRMILLEDIDRGLHPSAQQALIQQLMGIASPACRIVCTAHSPYVLDPLSVDAVRVVIADESGATHIHPLAGHPEWPKWSGGMTPAEFWQYVGDDAWPVGLAG